MGPAEASGRIAIKCAILFDCGLRLGELLNLTLSNVDKEENRG
jgi:integrase